MEVFLLTPQPHHKKSATPLEKPHMKAGSSGHFKAMKDRQAGGPPRGTEAEGHCQKGTPSSCPSSCAPEAAWAGGQSWVQ